MNQKLPDPDAAVLRFIMDPLSIHNEELTVEELKAILLCMNGIVITKHCQLKLAETEAVKLGGKVEKLQQQIDRFGVKEKDAIKSQETRGVYF